MNEKILILVNSIRRDLDIIAEIYEELECRPLRANADHDTLIGIAYRLHNWGNSWTSCRA